ncbi:MAG: hypothetical protein SNJ76_10835, partial [Fimbriimonadaceae bacterium]
MTIPALLSLSAAAALANPGAPEPLEFHRKFQLGERATYEVQATLNSESRRLGTDTWMPEDLDIRYRFSYDVTRMLTDGIAVIRYRRPSITETQGETFERGPISRNIDLNMDLELQVSPINEILQIRDLAPKAPAQGAGSRPSRWAFNPVLSNLGIAQPQNPLGELLGQFVGEIYRLSLFMGSLDSSLDFAPRLSFEEVRPGDSWKRTVGYSPQKLTGRSERMAVQRLDYTFTYKGIVRSNNVDVHRIQATLDHKTDLAEFIHSTFGVKSEQTGLRAIPMEFKATIDYDLELRTHRTLRAVGNTQGGFGVIVNQFPNQPVEEERFKGRAVL